MRLKITFGQVKVGDTIVDGLGYIPTAIVGHVESISNGAGVRIGGGTPGTDDVWLVDYPASWALTVDRPEQAGRELAPGFLQQSGNRAERRGNPTHPHLRRGQRENVRNGGES